MHSSKVVARLAIGAALVLVGLAGCSGPFASDSSDGNGDGGSSDSTDSGPPLVISEVGSSPYINISAWLEVYNEGSESVDLHDLVLRTTVRERTNPYADNGDAVIQLPSLSIPPGGYALIRGRIDDKYVTSGRIAYVKTGSDEVPNWYGSGGYLELLADGETVDFVRFGDSTVSPTTSGEWDGGAAPALPTGSDNYGYAIARDGSNTDTHTASDWNYREFATPGGPNDVTTTADNDNDGIPDANETAGSTFAGMPLYEWGARTGQRDIFIHIDYMDSSDPGVTPRKAALDAVVAAFADQNISMHLDVGDLYDNAPGTDPSEYDLSDDSNQVPFNQALAFDEYTGYANLYEYKYAHMPIERKQIFHYALFGYSQNADGSGGSSGLAELYGNDFMVTLGNWGLTTASQEETNLLENFQASTFMHEFGHNLGLRHGGHENDNFKPNYFSIMNYLYQLRLLPDIGTTHDEGDRYYLEYGTKGYQYINDIHKNPYDNAVGSVNMDYSHGDGADLDETSVNESDGLGQPGGDGVDYDGDGTHDDSLGEFNLNSEWDGTIGTITDYDDWANIELFFARTYYGDTSGTVAPQTDDTPQLRTDPVWNDRQQIYPEKPPEKLLEWLEQRRESR